MGQPQPLFRLFLVFSNKHHYNFTTNICEKCPSSIRCQDSKPRPWEHESLPITTGPWLLPIGRNICPSTKKVRPNKRQKPWIHFRFTHLYMEPQNMAKSNRMGSGCGSICRTSGRTLQTQEMHSLNPIIGKFCLVSTALKTVLKRRTYIQRGRE